MGTVTTATSGRSPEFRKGSNPNPVEFVEDLLREREIQLMPTPQTMDTLPAREGEARERQLRRGDSSSRRSSSGNLREDILQVLPTPTTQDSSGICRDHGGDLLHEVTCGCSRATRRELMRTPTASQGEGGALCEEEARKRGNTVGIRDQAMDLAKLNGAKVSPDEMNVLPTPTTRDYKDGTAPHERDGVVQTDTISRLLFNSGEILLPTPTAVEGTKSMTYKNVDEKKGQTNLTNVVNTAAGVNAENKGYLGSTDVHWGKFEPAIRRWEEVLGRPAPAPTKPDGKDGAHRLSSAFTEFMMGLEPGWITDVGLTRNEELKACGNGVVPQQAELALRILLEGVDALSGKIEAGQELSTLDPQTDNSTIGSLNFTAEDRQ